MNIYLIRHAEAEPASYNKTDDERELTENGILFLKTSIEVWRKFDIHFDVIISSPLKRALQTSHIIKDLFDVSTEVLPDNSLMNGGNTNDLLRLAESLEFNNIGMVGHQPDIGIHSGLMSGANNANLKIPPAAVIKVHFKSKPVIGKGILELLLQPMNKNG